MLKDKEIQIIKETTKVIKGTKRMVGNAITLFSNDEITLVTNGDVIEGMYKRTLHGEKYVKFAHNIGKYNRPYIASEYYADYKDLIYTAWNKYFYTGSEARVKYNEVLKVMEGEEVQATQEIKQEIKIEETIIKEEVTMKSTKVNIMALAHQIRREEKLEGHYHVQMKIAMKMAWAQVKGGQATVVSKPVIMDSEESSYIFAPIAFNGTAYTYALKDKHGNICGRTMDFLGKNPVVADVFMRKSFKQLFSIIPANTTIVLLGNSCLTLSKIDQGILKAIENKKLRISVDLNSWLSKIATTPSGDAV